MNSKIFIFFISSIFLSSNLYSVGKKLVCTQAESCAQNFTATNVPLNLSSTFSCFDLSKNVVANDSSLLGQSAPSFKTPQFKYVIFDICRSFWKKSLYDLLYAYQKKKSIPFSYYFTMAKFGISYALGTLDPKEAYESFLKYCKGASCEELKIKCSQLWQQECKKFVFMQAKELFEKHKQEGAIMILTEAGFEELYGDLCSEYKFDYRYASKLEFKDGKITGKLVGLPCSGKEKLEQVKNLIENKLGGSLKEAVFYANSHNDIPLLEKVGKPVAVNPDSKLESYAKKKGWQILRFSRINN